MYFPYLWRSIPGPLQRVVRLPLNLPLNHMVLQPAEKFFPIYIAACNAQDHCLLIVDRCFNLMPIEHKDQLHGRMANPCISINNWMISD